MPKIQFNIPDAIDKELKHYMIDEAIVDKRNAIIKILREKLI